MRSVDLIHYGVQFLTHCIYLFSLCLILSRMLYLSNIKCIFKLLQYGTLLRLVGMEFKAERTETDFVQSLFYY